MATGVNISDELVMQARIRGEVFKRIADEQTEYWAKIGQLAEENPDLPMPFIQDILTGKEQIRSGLGTPYVFGEGK
ncbi:hypothetical protein QUF80_01190 [Desulfococcaceae bacterium HSG8]|nr:hypothetical protein [Desulfococcaceae bacterium HSG8]